MNHKSIDCAGGGGDHLEYMLEKKITKIFDDLGFKH